MNAAAIPVPQLACLLHDAADGVPADTAAAELIDAHGHFLHCDAFRRIISTGSYSGQPAAVIRWTAAIWALDNGYLPCSSSERAILRIAASLADPAIAINLRDNLGNLDYRNITLVTGAITRANG